MEPVGVDRELAPAMVRLAGLKAAGQPAGWGRRLELMLRSRGRAPSSPRHFSFCSSGLQLIGSSTLSREIALKSTDYRC